MQKIMTFFITLCFLFIPNMVYANAGSALLGLITIGPIIGIQSLRVLIFVWLFFLAAMISIDFRIIRRHVTVSVGRVVAILIGSNIVTALVGGFILYWLLAVSIVTAHNMSIIILFTFLSSGIIAIFDVVIQFFAFKVFLRPQNINFLVKKLFLISFGTITVLLFILLLRAGLISGEL